MTWIQCTEQRAKLINLALDRYRIIYLCRKFKENQSELYDYAIIILASEKGQIPCQTNMHVYIFVQRLYWDEKFFAK